MKRRIFPNSVTVESYVVPHGDDRGRTRYVASISDERYSRELFWAFDHASVVGFARRSAGQRGVPVVDTTAGGKWKK